MAGPKLAEAEPSPKLGGAPAPKRTLWGVIGPGILVAATGVGAGDLITASIAGSRTGLVILWAAAWGVALKWALSEGIARWQLATNTTLLEGWFTRLGGWAQWVFMPYFFLWSFLVGGALVNACGVAATGVLQLGSPNTSKIIWGIIHSMIGLALVKIGGFRLVQRVMAFCIGCMFIGVVATGILLVPDWGQVLRGILVPSVPPDGAPWMLGVLGGVGGTVTLLSYGYWIREQGRKGEEAVRTCRIDLGVAYVLTGIFGMSMIVIGSGIEVEGRGAQLALQLAQQLDVVLGPAGRAMFLAGFWAAVFASMLGVWQSAPYLFADFMNLRGRARLQQTEVPVLSNTRSYKAYSLGIATLPLISLWLSVQQIQLAYAVMGAMFMPFLAVTLLIMNNREAWVGQSFRTGWLINAVLGATLLLFVVLGALQVFSGMPGLG